jgi:NADPH:quinone reductase-like Zn-dependent oxidoreductase
MFQAMLLGPWISMTGSKKMDGLSAKVNQKDLVFVKELLEAGKVRPVIDRRYPLDKVPEALQYFGKGDAKGKIIITVDHKDNPDNLGGAP